MAQNKTTTAENNASLPLTGEEYIRGVQSGGNVKFQVQDILAGGFKSPLTTKGDLTTYDTITTRLPVGTDGQCLESDSTQPTGLKWSSRLLNFISNLASGIGSSLVGFTMRGTSATARFVQDVLRERPVNVTDFGAVADGVTDNAPFIALALAVNGRINFPIDKNGGTNYAIGSGIRLSAVGSIDFDPGVTLTALPGFTGLSITKAGSPFTLKAMIAVFVGTNIGSQSDTRMSERGKKVYIGPGLLDCAGNADYGLLMNSVQGPEVHCDTVNASQYGMWFGPYCWASKVNKPRIMRSGVGGIYIGAGCNGFTIDTPEIWGDSVVTTYGVYIDGAPGGTVGATGAVEIHGGYIEKCQYGVTLNNAGQVNVLSVDIEAITGNAIVSTCTAGATYGIINVIGGNLNSTNTAISNSNAYVVVDGVAVVNGATLEPFTSLTNNSIFKIVSCRYFDSSGIPTINPTFSTANIIDIENQSTAKATYFHKSITPSGGSYSPVWEHYNLTSPNQSAISSSGFPYVAQQLADTNLTNRTEVDLFARITDTNSGTPRNKSEVRLQLGFDSSTEAKLVFPDSVLDVSLGTTTNAFQRAVAGNFVATSAPISQGAGTVVIGGTTATTVGAAGGA